MGQSLHMVLCNIEKKIPAKGSDLHRATIYGCYYELQSHMM